MAFDDAGLGVPVPLGVPVRLDHVITGAATALELCSPSDLPHIIEALERALAVLRKRQFIC